MDLRGEKSWGFSLDLKKLDNTLSFFCVNALQLQSAYKKKMQMGGRSKNIIRASL